MLETGQGSHTYEWIDNWATIPAAGRANGRTHAVTATQAGTVIVFHQADPALLEFRPDGTLIRAWGDGLTGAHGMCRVIEDGVEFLWLTDQNSGAVVKMDLGGQVVARISRPELPVYRNGGKYSPTWVAVNEERFGGNGDVWVADGYGSSYVHRHRKDGTYVASINGEEGSTGAFACPHGVFVDTRRGEPELYVADRGNHRVQVYDVEGRHKRSFGQDFLNTPCCFVTVGEYLMMPEHRAYRVTVLDGTDSLVCTLGEQPGAGGLEGWPNVGASLLAPGKFNSPHGIAADASGKLFVVEWIVGGRITKLAPKR